MTIYKSPVEGVILQSTANGPQPWQFPKEGYRATNFSAANYDKKSKFVTGYGCGSCRDGLCGMFQRGITGAPAIGGKKWPSDELETDKMKLMVVLGLHTRAAELAKEREEVFGQIERASKLLNIMEKFAGWPLTRIYPVKTPRNPYSDTKLIYFFYGSRRWVKASPMVSLYALVIRMAKDPAWGKVKTIDDMEKLGQSGQRFECDATWIQQTSPYWKKVLSGYPKLFRAKKITTYWTDMSSGTGLAALVNGNANAETNRVFRSL